MMSRFNFLAVLCLSIVCVSIAGSQPAMAARFAKPASVIDGTEFSFSGRVTRVDYAANSVEMMTDGRRVTVSVEPTTVIDVGGEPGSVSDIRPGIRIRVEGIVRGGAYIAQTIAIL